MKCWLTLWGIWLLPVVAWAAEPLPLVFSDDFEQGRDHWVAKDPQGWRIESRDRGQVFSQFLKESPYQPPHRSPFHMALVKDVQVGDFVLDVEVLSTHPDYGHRDVCLFFGYQDPAHFYYVHLGKKADDHANQIFIVNDAPRTKISSKTTPGTDWDDEWHHVRIERTTQDGQIRVYFDDLENPVMVATDRHFSWGQVGVGSFDDTSAWDNFRLRGKRK